MAATSQIASSSCKVDKTISSPHLQVANAQPQPYGRLLPPPQWLFFQNPMTLVEIFVSYPPMIADVPYSVSQHSGLRYQLGSHRRISSTFSFGGFIVIPVDSFSVCPSFILSCTQSQYFILTPRFEAAPRQEPSSADLGTLLQKAIYNVFRCIDLGSLLQQALHSGHMPTSAAAWSAVLSLSIAAGELTSAPRSRRCPTMEMCPPPAASWSAVLPSLDLSSISTPLEIWSLRSSRGPRFVAQRNAPLSSVATAPG